MAMAGFSTVMSRELWKVSDTHYANRAFAARIPAVHQRERAGRRWRRRTGAVLMEVANGRSNPRSGRRPLRTSLRPLLAREGHEGS